MRLRRQKKGSWLHSWGNGELARVLPSRPGAWYPPVEDITKPTSLAMHGALTTRLLHLYIYFYILYPYINYIQV